MVHVVKTVKEAVEQNMMRYFLWWKCNSDASLSLSLSDGFRWKRNAMTPSNKVQVLCNLCIFSVFFFVLFLITFSPSVFIGNVNRYHYVTAAVYILGGYKLYGFVPPNVHPRVYIDISFMTCDNSWWPHYPFCEHPFIFDVFNE